MRKSVFGLSENVASMLCYVGLLFSGIVILVMEKENKTVRFHALQSVLWFMLLNVASFAIRFLPIIRGPLSSLLWLVTVVSWAFLMYMAYMGKKFKMPLVGDAVELQINKMG